MKNGARVGPPGSALRGAKWSEGTGNGKGTKPNVGMTFLKIDLDFVRDHKHDVLAKKLKVTLDRALRLVLTLYSTVAEHARSGNLLDVPDESIARWSGWASKKVPASAFVGALQKAGWLTADRQVSGWKERYAKVLPNRKRGDGPRKKPETFSAESADIARSRELDVPTEQEKETPTPPAKNAGGSSVSKPGSGRIKKPDRSHEVQSRWNLLAGSLGLPVAESMNEDRRRLANLAAVEGLLDRWTEFEAALRGPAGVWHREQGVGFDWLVRKKCPWQALIERGKAPPQTVTTTGARVGAHHAAYQREIDSVTWEHDDGPLAEEGRRP